MSDGRLLVIKMVTYR